MKWLIRVGIFVLSILVVVACGTGEPVSGNGDPGADGAPDEQSFSIQIEVSATEAFFSQEVTLGATITGAELDDVAIEWHASGGELLTSNGATVTWVAPVEENEFDITATATYGADTAEATITLLSLPDPSVNYLVISADAEHNRTTFNQEVELRADIIGPDAAGAQFEWEVASGSGHVYPTVGATVDWRTGTTAGTTTIRVSTTVGGKTLKKEKQLEVVVPLEILGITPEHPRAGLGSERVIEVQIGGYFADKAEVGVTYHPTPGTATGGAAPTPRGSAIKYQAPNLHGSPLTREDLTEQIEIWAYYDSWQSATRTIPIAIDFCDAGDYTNGDQPCEISNIYQLQKITSTAERNAGHFALTNHIDASATANWNGASGFTPLRFQNNPFTGTFNGNGYEIDGLHIDNATQEHAGLFAELEGELRNLTLTNASVTGDKYVGAVAAQVRMGGVVENVRLDRSIVQGNFAVGGIIGMARDLTNPVNIDQISELTNLHVTDSEVHLTNPAPSPPPFDDGAAGGAVGVVLYSNVSDISVTNTVVTGNTGAIGGVLGGIAVDSTVNGGLAEQVQVTASAPQDALVGGFAGIIEAPISHVEVRDSVVTTSSGFGGGLAGEGRVDWATSHISNSAVRNSQVHSIGNTGDVKGLGGFIGHNLGLIDNSVVVDVEVSGQNNLAGFVGINQDGAEISNSRVIDSSVEVGGVETLSMWNRSIAGFVSDNYGKIVRTSVTGTGVNGAHQTVGGFASINQQTGFIQDAYVYSPRAVVSGIHTDIAGFVAVNLSTIERAYSVVGRVSGNERVAGFAAYMRFDGNVSQVFASSATLTGNNRGGLIAENDTTSGSSVTASFWNATTSGTTLSPGGGIAINNANDLGTTGTYASYGWQFEGTNAPWQMPAGDVTEVMPDLSNHSRF